MHCLRLFFAFALSLSVGFTSELRQIDPAFKQEVIERHPTGGDKRILISHPTKSGIVVVQELELYPNGAVALAFDVKQKEDGSRVQEGACLHYRENGTLLAHYTFSNGKLDGVQVTYDENGTTLTHINFCKGVKEGKSLAYHPNGQVKEEANFIAGKCAGEAVAYFPSGAIEKRMTFADGMRDGLVEIFNESGTCIRRENYIADQLETTKNRHAIEECNAKGQLRFVQDYKMGRPHGLCMRYDDEGHLLYVVEYVDGQKQGKEEFFAADGTSLGSGLFAHGTPVGAHHRKHLNGNVAYVGQFDEVGLSKEPVREYFENGNLAREYVLSPKGYEGQYKELDEAGHLLVRRHFVNGELDGEQLVFYANGHERLEAHFVQGKRHGVVRQWRESGELESESHFVEDKLDGLAKRWHVSGALSAKEPYVQGLLEGVLEKFYESGRLRERSEFKEGRLHGIVQAYSEEGKLIQESEFANGLQSGSHKLWYENGDRKVEARFVNGKIDGPYFEWAPKEKLIKSHYFVESVPHGEQKTYFPKGDGRLASIGTFDHGRPIKDHKKWYENGRLAELCTYDDAGRLEGKRLSFNSDGVVVEEAEYTNGLLDGLFRQVDTQSGREVISHYQAGLKHGRHEVRYPKQHALIAAQIALSADYEAGELHGFVKSFSEEGKLISSVPYAHGKKEGMAELFTKNGEKHRQVPFDNDRREGVAVEFHPNGKTHLEVTFVEGKKEGIEKQYFPNGKLAAERSYKADLLDGPLREWSENETLLCEASYEMGKRSGAFKKFYPDGKPKVEQTFVGDKLDGVKKSYDSRGRLTESLWKMGERVEGASS